MTRVVYMSSKILQLTVGSRDLSQAEEKQEQKGFRSMIASLQFNNLAI